MTELGTMRAGRLEVPVTSVRLVGGEVEFAGAVRATWRRPIRASGGPVQVVLYGRDGLRVAAPAGWRVDVPALPAGGVYRLVLTLRLTPECDAVAWVALRRVAAELPPPPRRAIPPPSRGG